MATVRLTEPDARNPSAAVEADALDLAARLPHILLEARRVQAAMSGIHGRRRAGPGEAFWQFRPYAYGEAAARIDWRRSGRDDRLYVRQREWEASHAIHLWIDRSASMGYASSLAGTSKIERAFVIGLALADALVDGGERVGLIGLLPPRSARHIAERFAHALVHDLAGRDRDAPDETPLAPTAEVVLVTDGLVPAETFARTIGSIGGRGARGHVVRIVDPVEELFPFTGEAILEDVEGTANLRVGDTVDWGKRYRARFAAHGDALRAACHAIGWTFTSHRTDRPATEPTLRAMTMLANARRGPGGG